MAGGGWHLVIRNINKLPNHPSVLGLTSNGIHGLFVLKTGPTTTRREKIVEGGQILFLSRRSDQAMGLTEVSECRPGSHLVLLADQTLRWRTADTVPACEGGRRVPVCRAGHPSH